MNHYTRALAELKAQPCHKLGEVGDQWQTPPALYWGINALFGPFLIDLFTDGENSKCPRFYTAENNALLQDWAKDLAGGKAFANPPYSRSSYDDDKNAIIDMIEQRASELAQQYASSTLEQRPHDAEPGEPVSNPYKLPENNELSGNSEELAATECVDQSGTDIDGGTCYAVDR